MASTNEVFWLKILDILIFGFGISSMKRKLEKMPKQYPKKNTRNENSLLDVLLKFKLF